MIIGDKYRITVLTDRLIRLEFSENGSFTDEMTQTVVNRDFPEVNCQVKDEEYLLIDTGALLLKYDKQTFSSLGLSILVKSTGNTWHFGAESGFWDRNLWGTGRTLDNADGRIMIETGIFSRLGYAVIDDSNTALFTDGEFIDRNSEGTDIYFFGYGSDFRQGLKDFFRLTGPVPMVPRYVLGNWWSRYHRYTQDSYNAMLDKMAEENIPLSVAVIDMDWHITNVDERFGSGWTGYTWDKECFPDHRAFLKGLKDRKLAATLNLHPADGVRAFEEQYEVVAKELGLDTQNEEPAEFDFANPDFRKAYFKHVMHPYEDEGVDFWWIDWQQGTRNKTGNVDPLFLLNHYHYEDSKRNNKRGLIFSRYGGVGSHRYPVGFSGDTITTWKSLEFQPYFTATASNIGYGWWSHDIGGHMMGSKDEERLIRWIEFGVFSPIMRLHSSNSPFFNKEPWNVDEPYRSIMGDFMRLRHRLIPYIYTMNRLAAVEGQMLIEPMYYRNPESEAAYQVDNEYYFGTNLVVGAITEKIDDTLRMAKVNMLIPDGRHYDIFNGRVYSHGGKRNLYRKLSEIPVLIPAGGIVPLSTEDKENGTELPRSLRLLVGAGANGSFDLYEDDGTTMDYLNGNSVTTSFKTFYDAKENMTQIIISGANGDLSHIPAERSYEIVLYGVQVDDANVILDSEKGPVRADSSFDLGRHTLTVKLEPCNSGVEQKLMITGVTLAENDYVRETFDMMSYAWCDTLDKEKAYEAARNAQDADEYRTWIMESDLDVVFRDALLEFLF